MSRSLYVAAGLAFAAGMFATSIAVAQNPPVQNSSAPSQSAPSQSVSSPQPVCIYHSATYSDGAYICAQKSTMLSCQVDGMKATWKAVTDKDMNERCVSSSMPPQASRRARMRRQFTGAQVYSDPSAKCFNFNGKRYCE